MSKIRFIKAGSVKKPAIRLSEIINNRLEAGDKVLLLLSGGSSIAVAEKVLKEFDGQNLIIAQVDERYGDVGHKDSNWQKIKDTLKLGDAHRLCPVLSGENFLDTIEDYDSLLKELYRQSDYKIAVLGIGADGHTAGLLPNCPALESKDFVAGYEGPDYIRISIAPRAVKKLDSAIVYATGKSKKKALDSLEDNLDDSSQPAQLLKKIKGEVYIYNDQKEGVI